MKPQAIATFAGFLVMAAIGWQLAGEAPRTEPGASAAETSPVTKTARRQTPHRGLYQTPDYAKARMRAIRMAGDPREQMRLTIELVQSLSLSELEKWQEGRWFDDCEGFDMTLFNKIATERWMQEDPEGLVLWRKKNGYGNAQVILDSWAKDDPQRLLTFFKEHPDPEMELGALRTLATSQPALVLGRLREMIGAGLGLNSSGGYEARRVLAELAKTNPAALESALDSLPDQWRSLAEAGVINQKLKTSFETEIQNLFARPDGWKIFENTNLGGDANLVGKLVGELPNLPESWKASLASNYYRFMTPANSRQWLDADLEGCGFTKDQAKKIRQGALGYLSYEKPDEALKLMNEVGLSDANRRSLIENIFRNNRRNSEKIESMLALLGSEEDRQIARSASAAESGTPSPAKIEKPSDWLEQAGASDSKTGDTYRFISQLRQWESAKVAEVATQFRKLPDEQKRNVAHLLVNNNDGIDPSLSGEAIRYLIANPDPAQEGQPNGNAPRSTQQASDLAVQWGQRDPIAASAWVQSLPAGEAQLWAQKNLAANWAQYDPDAASSWVKSLPASSRAEVEQFMKTGHN